MFFLSQVKMPIDAGLFSIFDSSVGKSILRFHESNKYISGLRSYVGFSQAPYYYHREARTHGTAKSIYQLIRMGLNAFFAFTGAPLRISAIMCLSSFTITTTMLILGIWSGSFQAAMLLMASCITMCGACLGEYIGRIHMQVKERPDYFIKTIIKNGDIAHPISNNNYTSTSKE